MTRTSASCKDECEALMSALLPVAEQLLSEHRVLRPFGCTLSADDRIVRVGGHGGEPAADDAALIAQFREAFRDGAARGELKATALSYSAASAMPGKAAPQAAVFVHLNHRDNYSIVVTFPYHFGSQGELVIEEPFANDGEHDVFQPDTSGILRHE
ncbi:MAG TPA: hypothetical protein VER11_00995 [Polyangiaceae bacterium]|nr:hypothetical protein [Polyangiaceae bacterium]